MKEEFTGKDAEALSFIPWELWICVAASPLASGQQKSPRHGCKSGPSSYRSSRAGSSLSNAGRMLQHQPPGGVLVSRKASLQSSAFSVESVSSQLLFRSFRFLADWWVAIASRVMLESLSAQCLRCVVRHGVSYLFHLCRFVSVELVAPGETLRRSQLMRLKHAETDPEILVFTDRN